MSSTSKRRVASTGNTSSQKKTRGDNSSGNRWFFSMECGDIFVFKFGKSKEPKPHKLDGDDQPRKVEKVLPSKNKPDIVKILFHGTSQPILFKLPLFDSEGNDFSKKYANAKINTESFCSAVMRTLDCGSSEEIEIPQEMEGDKTIDDSEQRTAITCRKSRSQSSSKKSTAPPTVPQQPVFSQPDEDSKSAVATDAEFELHVKNSYELAGGKTFKVLASTLVPPRAGYTLRKLDADFVTTLEKEMVLRPLNFGKPLIAVVTSVKQQTDFKEDDMDCYTLEVIGGNHRREAIKRLIASGQDKHQKFVDVQLFCEMPNEEALRLATLHNNLDETFHKLCYLDKIELGRKLLQEQYDGNKSSALWKQTCAALCNESLHQQEYISFLSSLSDAPYALIVSIFTKYAQCQLKGQKATKNEGAQKPNCPPFKFRCLRGDLREEEVMSLLSEVDSGIKSLQEMESEAKRIKEIREVQRIFVNETGAQDWDDAVQRFPPFVKEEHLSAFRAKPKAKKGVLHPAFQNFISRALEWELVKDETMEESSSRLDFHVMDISVHGYILNSNAKEINNISLGTAVPDFLGTPLLFLDLPEDWNATDLEKLSRTVRAVNTRKNVQNFTMVIFPHGRNLIDQLSILNAGLKDLEVVMDLAYFCSRSNKDVEEYSGISPMVFCHFGNKHEVSLGGKLVVEMADPQSHDEEGRTYQRQKPVALYTSLIKTYAQPHSWILDVCSGAGSAAVAGVSMGHNVVVIERQEVRCRSIKRRLRSAIHG